MGVALNGAYVADDSTDYVTIGNACPESALGNYQRFLQYQQSVESIRCAKRENA